MRFLKRNKIYITLILVGVFLLCTGGVQATTLERQVVEKDKVWIISFNKDIQLDSRAIKAISVLDDKGDRVQIRLQLGEDKKSILVKPPIRMYNEGKNYTLKIEKDIYSRKGSKLKEEKEIKFSVKNKDGYKDFIKLDLDQAVQSEEERQYIFYDMQKLKGVDERTLEDNGWQLDMYRINKTNDIKYMVSNGKDAKELAIPIKAKGWLGLYVGYSSNTEEFNIKFKDEEFKFKNYKTNKNKVEDKFINEVFMFADNFNEENITILPVEGKKAQIAYIKLVAFNDDQVKLYNTQSKNWEKKTVIYDNDGYTDFFRGKYPDIKSLEKFVEDAYLKLQGSQINWTIGTTGLLNYHSNYAGPSFLGSFRYDNYIREGDKLARDQILNLLYSGKSTLELVSNKSDLLGVDVNASLRMNAFYWDKSTQFLNGIMYEFYKDCIQKDSYMLSYYYPRYREYILNILKEASIQGNIEGITLDFCRYPYVMGGEATKEERVIIMNEFMRLVRKEIPNKKINVRFTYSDSLSYGLDVDTWVKEGLVDRIIPSVISYEEFWNLEGYSSIVENSNVELLVGIAADLKGNDLTPETEKLLKEGLYTPNNVYVPIEEYLYRAYEAYNEGFDGVFLFNTLNDIDIREEISPKFQILGDEVKVRKWYEFEYKSYIVNHKIDWITS